MKLTEIAQFLETQKAITKDKTTPRAPQRPASMNDGHNQRGGLGPMIFHTISLAPVDYTRVSQNARPLLVSPGVVFQPKTPAVKPSYSSQIRRKKKGH